MQHLANLDCFFLAKEMNASLAGGFFENFYDYSEGVFRLRFGKQSVLFDLQGFAFVAVGSFPEPPRQPSSFAMLLRKRLASAKLESVAQLGFDRIFEFSFTSKQYGRHSLVVELFGKRGNLLLFFNFKVKISSLSGGEEIIFCPSTCSKSFDALP